MQDGATKWYYFLSKPAGRPAGRPADRPATRPPQCFIRRKSPNMSPPIILLCLSQPIMSVSAYYVCPHLFCVSRYPPIRIYLLLVCPHLLCLSPSIMSVPTYYVCPQLSCLSPPSMSVLSYYVYPPPFMFVPTYYVCPHQSFSTYNPFLNLECRTSSPTF